MHLGHRQTCRVCGSNALRPVISLGDQHIQGVFAKPGEESPPLRKVPLTLLRCDPTTDQNACGLLQTSVTVPPDILYYRYWYRSGTNQTMRDHLKGVAQQTSQYLPQTVTNGPVTSVLDIGCNDGVLLDAIDHSVERWGIDPSNAVENIHPSVHVIRDLFPSPRITQSFDAITSIAMFYDLEDPVAFARAVKDLLRPLGVWVFEVAYMPQMLRNLSYDTICHEHLEYYSLATIERILDEADLRLIDVSLNPSNGGSIRCVAAVDREPNRAAIDSLRRQEFDLALDTDKPYLDFQERIETHRNELTKLIKGLKLDGKVIHAYGASTKGNTILQFCGLDATVIDCIADRNPDKWGARTVGTDIPIVSEAESRLMRPDYFLVLPWHFASEFIDRERGTLEAGTQMIFPLPTIRTVSSALVPA